MRQSEFKMKYDLELGRYTKQHIYGEGVKSAFESFGSKMVGKTAKKAAKSAGKAIVVAAEKTVEQSGKKAGDKVVKNVIKRPPPQKKKKTTTTNKKQKKKKEKFRFRKIQLLFQNRLKNDQTGNKQ